MKTAAAIAFLAFCGVASATLFQRQDNCQITDVNDAVDVINRCGTTQDVANAQTCTENCAGYICTYLSDNNYPGSCLGMIYSRCSSAGEYVPPSCGALALVTVKGVLVVVLLLAAFFIL